MNGHDFTREQNMEARIRLAAARRELADAVNDATTGLVARHVATIKPKWD